MPYENRDITPFAYYPFHPVPVFATTATAAGHPRSHQVLIKRALISKRQTPLSHVNRERHEREIAFYICAIYNVHIKLLNIHGEGVYDLLQRAATRNCVEKERGRQNTHTHTHNRARGEEMNR